MRKDLNKFSVDFESRWAEIKVNNRKTQNTILLNVTYSPNKNKTDIFLEQLATNIDNAIVKGHNIILMGDYNIYYLNSREKEKLDSILLPYHLEIQKKTEATRICKAGKTATLIDYFISDIYVKKNHCVRHSNSIWSFCPVYYTERRNKPIKTGREEKNQWPKYI